MRSTNSLLSVIVPVYNVEQYVQKCIESLANQTYQNLEIIVVDDGSTDNTCALCDNFAKKYDCVKVVHIQNNGVSNARNVGIDNSIGEYIAFVDGDDWIDPTMYQTMIANLQTNSADISACAFCTNDDSQIIGCSEPVLISKDLLFAQTLLNDDFGGYIGNKLFKRSLIGELRFDTNLHCSEDFVFVAQYLTKCNVGVSTLQQLYHYTYRPDSAVNDTKFSYNKLTLLDAYEKIMELYRVNSPQILNHLYKNYLKININLKGRYLISKIGDATTYSRLQNNIDKYYKLVIGDKSLSLLAKANIVLSKMFPKQILQLKQLITKISRG